MATHPHGKDGFQHFRHGCTPSLTGLSIAKMDKEDGYVGIKVFYLTIKSKIMPFPVGMNGIHLGVPCHKQGEPDSKIKAVRFLSDVEQRLSHTSTCTYIHI